MEPGIIIPKLFCPRQYTWVLFPTTQSEYGVVARLTMVWFESTSDEGLKGPDSLVKYPHEIKEASWSWDANVENPPYNSVVNGTGMSTLMLLAAPPGTCVPLQYVWPSTFNKQVALEPGTKARTGLGTDWKQAQTWGYRTLHKSSKSVPFGYRSMLPKHMDVFVHPRQSMKLP